MKLILIASFSIVAALLAGCGGNSPVASSGGTTGAGGTTTGMGAATGGTTTGMGGATGSTTTGMGGSTGSGSNAMTQAACEALGPTWFPCLSASQCVLADPAGAAGAWDFVCQSAFGALTPAEANLLAPCFTCFAQAAQAAGGKCFQSLPQGTCASVCDPTGTLSDKWGMAAADVPLPPAGLCTNGMSVLGGTCFGQDGNPNPCTTTCCNTYHLCSNPIAAATCTAHDAGPETCTCTAGKNTGKTFTQQLVGQGCGADDVWNICNL
jgi:hypothetical protein